MAAIRFFTFTVLRCYTISVASTDHDPSRDQVADSGPTVVIDPVVGLLTT